MSLLVIPATIDTAQITSTNATDSTTAWSATAFTLGQSVKHRNRRYQKAASATASVTCTFTNGSATVGATAHGRAVDDIVRLSTTGTLPTGFATGTDYFVVSAPTADTLTLSATQGGTAITASGTGSGTHTLWFAPGSDIVADSSGNWIDIGPTNDFAMFDDSSITQTERTGSLTVTLTTGSKFDTVGLINLSGVRYVTISATTGGTTIYNRTYPLFDSSFADAWYSPYHSLLSFKTRMAVSDIPPLSGAVVTITLTGASTGTVKCGGCHVGLSLPLGDMTYGASAGIEDYVRVTLDEYGKASKNNGRGYSATFIGQVFASHAKSDAVKSLIATRRGNETLFLLAPDANAPGGWDPTGVIFGLPTNFKRRFEWPSHNQFDLEVLGIGSGDALEFSEAPVWNFGAIESLGTWALTRASSGVRTNSSGVLEGKTTNVARYEYKDSILQGLLIEGARTNLFKNSQEFDNSNWLKQFCTVTSNTTTGADGTTTADTINFTADALAAIYQSGISGTGQRTVSVWAKGAGQKFRFIAYNGTDGTLYGPDIDLTDTLTRYSHTFTVSASSGFYIANASDGVLRSIQAWGAQVEDASTPSSYIFTTATATRAADLVTLTSTNFSSWWNPLEGTIIVEAICTGVGTTTIWQVDAGATSNRLHVYAVGTTVYADVILFGSAQGPLIIGTLTPGVPFKAAFTFSAISLAGCVDNGAVVSTASGGMPTVNTMRLGADTSGATHPVIISYVKTLPYRVSNAELPGFTT